MNAAQTAERLLRAAAPTLPLPGAGDTARRHRRLLDLGRRDLSLGRLAEAHADALAILAEAGREPRPGTLYGVWAADRPGHRLTVRPAPGGLLLQGSKAFCTGLSLCDAALVTAVGPGSDRPLLLELDLRAGRAAGALHGDAGSWATPAFAATDTGTLQVADDGLTVPRKALVGAPGWYLERPGFWHGAVGPAAVWAGGAAGLIDAALARPTDNPHRQAQLGALAAQAWGLRALLDQAGAEIDLDPHDRSGRARARALSVRHLVERAATDVLDRFGLATGPMLLAFDGDVARRHTELSLYIRQCHGESDLAALYRCGARPAAAADPPPTGPKPCASAP